MNKLNNQLIVAVQHKLQLSEQLEQWQVLNSLLFTPPCDLWIKKLTNTWTFDRVFQVYKLAEGTWKFKINLDHPFNPIHATGSSFTPWKQQRKRGFQMFLGGSWKRPETWKVIIRIELYAFNFHHVVLLQFDMASLIDQQLANKIKQDNKKKSRKRSSVTTSKFFSAKFFSSRTNSKEASRSNTPTVK